jgi:hypothetical protein
MFLKRETLVNMMIVSIKKKITYPDRHFLIKMCWQKPKQLYLLFDYQARFKIKKSKTHNSLRMVD